MIILNEAVVITLHTDLFDGLDISKPGDDDVADPQDFDGGFAIGSENFVPEMAPAFSTMPDCISP